MNVLPETLPRWIELIGSILKALHSPRLRDYVPNVCSMLLNYFELQIYPK